MNTIYSASDVSKVLKITSWGVRKLARKHKIGRCVASVWLFDAADIEALRKHGRNTKGNDQNNNHII